MQQLMIKCCTPREIINFTMAQYHINWFRILNSIPITKIKQIRVSGGL